VSCTRSGGHADRDLDAAIRERDNCGATLHLTFARILMRVEVEPLHEAQRWPLFCCRRCGHAEASQCSRSPYNRRGQVTQWHIPLPSLRALQSCRRSLRRSTSSNTYHSAAMQSTTHLSHKSSVTFESDRVHYYEGRLAGVPRGRRRMSGAPGPISEEYQSWVT